MRLRFWVHLAAVLVLAALIAAGAGVLLWRALGQPRLSPSKPGPLAPSDLYSGAKIALAVVAGIGGVVALVVAYRKQRFAERDHQRENTKLFTERFGQASEQLGSDKAAVRLAGVYAMASLADDWEEGRQMCIDVLCAYLRMPYTPPADQPADPAAGNSERADNPAEVDKEARETQQARLEERQVRHTIIRAITAHLREGAPVSWQGCDFDFTGAVFDGGDFTRAVFSGGQVDFTGATFSGVVNFLGTIFFGSRVNFVSTTFSSKLVNFFGAKFLGGEVDFISAKLLCGEVKFSEAEFVSCIIGFPRVKFCGSEVSFLDTKFSGSEVDFSNATFSGGKVDLRHARAYGTPLIFDPWTDGPPDGLLLPLEDAAEDDALSVGDAVS